MRPLASALSGCASSQPVTFSLDANPTTGVAGTFPLGSAATNASLDPTGVAMDASGNLLIEDWDNDVIRIISPARFLPR